METTVLEMLNAAPEEVQRLFQPYHPPFIDTHHKNMEITKVFAGIMKDLRYTLSRMSNAKYRTYIMTNYEKGDTYKGCVLFEFVSVLCSLTLSVKDYIYFIELQTDTDIRKVVGKHNYNRMIRCAWRATMYETTQHDLEDSITVDTDLLDHYNYWKARLLEADNDNTLIMVEDAIVE